MHPLSPLADTLLDRLAAEEDLLRAALANQNEVHAALRRGDPAEAQALAAEQPALAADMRRAAEARAAAREHLARELHLNPDRAALADLAAQLPAEPAGRLLAVRDLLRALTAEIQAVQARNANLIAHLRSFLRGALTAAGAPEPASRYGPSGSRLSALPRTTT
jgi:gamma-glutamyl:cysteine ligase YbdK (ATP-grasp superfamily)